MSMRGDSTGTPTASMAVISVPMAASSTSRSWIIRSNTTSMSRLRSRKPLRRCTSTKPGAVDVRQRGGHRRVEALGVADREHRAVPRRQRDQAVRLLERPRHRLLDQHRHAARQERPGQLGVQLGRRGHDHGVDRRQRRGVGEGLGAVRGGNRRRRGPRRDRRRRPASRRASPRGCGRGACPDARRRRRRRAAASLTTAPPPPDVAAWRCRPTMAMPASSAAATSAAGPSISSVLPASTDRSWRRRRASRRWSARRRPARRSACPASASPP